MIQNLVVDFGLRLDFFYYNYIFKCLALIDFFVEDMSLTNKITEDPKKGKKAAMTKIAGKAQGKDVNEIARRLLS